MKKHLLILVLICNFNSNIRAQNILLNPSFEIHNDIWVQSKKVFSAIFGVKLNF